MRDVKFYPPPQIFGLFFFFFSISLPQATAGDDDDDDVFLSLSKRPAPVKKDKGIKINIKSSVGELWVISGASLRFLDLSTNSVFFRNKIPRNIPFHIDKL